jgi:DNA-binding NarL/FixJ family response regulator
LDAELTWDKVLALEPGRQERLSAAQFDVACQAMADFVDIKSVYTLGHSSGVAALAAAAAQRAGEAVTCILAAAGHRVAPSRHEQVGGLSEREVEVLRLLARGHSTKQIAAALVISPKTADHHIQHIYTKIGVSTRAGATLYAMEHHLLTEK